MAEDQTGPKRSDHEETIKALPGRHLIAIENPMNWGSGADKRCFVYEEVGVAKKGVDRDTVGTSVLVTLDINNKRPVWVVTGTMHAQGKRPMKIKGRAEGVVRLKCIDLIEGAGMGDHRNRLVNGGLGVQYFRHMNEDEVALFDTLHPDWVEEEEARRAESARQAAEQVQKQERSNNGENKGPFRILKG